MEAIYARPQDYDLEHEGDEADVLFYLSLLSRWRPRRVMELASGSGRVTIPLACAAAEAGIEIVGLERDGPMLEEARRKRAGLDPSSRAALSFVEGDMRDWRSAEPFDLIIAPCSSLSHLLALDDQIAAWTCAYRALTHGGRFIADLTMPSLTTYADSMQSPPRTLLEMDIDTSDPVTGTRMLRYKTTRYVAHEQRSEIRFLYDKFPDADGHTVPDRLAAPPFDRYVSDFACHVYYPREVDLLFRLTGFSVERWFGDYTMRPLRAASRQMIAVGLKQERV